MLLRLAFVITLLLITSTALADTAPDRALELHDEAKQLYARGKYNEAVEKLELAVELDPEARILYYNLGLIEEKLGHIDTALAYFRRCLELEPKHEEKLRLARAIKRLEGARRYVDWTNNQQGAPVIIRRDSGDTTPQPAATSPLLLWAYIAGGTALVAAGVGVGLAVAAGSADPGDAPATEPGLTRDMLQDQADEAHSLAIGADVTFGIAAAAFATSIALALMSSHGVGTETAQSTLTVGPTGASWTLRF